MHIAVAIPTYNRDEVLISTIEQLFAQAPPADEVLVIDQSDGHQPEVQDRLARWDAEGRIRYIRHRPPNLPAARNCALRETRCEAVIFIDDDVRLMPGFVEAHRRALTQEPAPVAVAGRFTQPPEATNTGRPTHPWRATLDYRFLDMDAAEPRQGVSTFVGGNHSVRVAAALGLGGYDERFAGVALREESDMALRLYLSGAAIRYEPTAHLVHLRVPYGGCRPRDRYDTSGGESILHFAFKHRPVLGRSGFLHEVWIGLRHFLFNRQAMARPDVFLARLGRLVRWMGRRRSGSKRCESHP